MTAGVIGTGLAPFPGPTRRRWADNWSNAGEVTPNVETTDRRRFRMNERSMLEVVAYHEAGHAVMALAQGWSVPEVAVTSPWSGYCASRLRDCQQTRSQLACGARERLIVLSQAIAEIKILLAGPLAEKEFVGRLDEGPSPYDYADFDRAIELASAPDIDPLFELHVPLGLDGLITEVTEWILYEKTWDTIRMVAEATLNTRRLHWEELLALLVENRYGKGQWSLW